MFVSSDGPMFPDVRVPDKEWSRCLRIKRRGSQCKAVHHGHAPQAIRLLKTSEMLDSQIKDEIDIMTTILRVMQCTGPRLHDPDSLTDMINAIVGKSELLAFCPHVSPSQQDA